MVGAKAKRWGFRFVVATALWLGLFFGGPELLSSVPFLPSSAVRPVASVIELLPLWCLVAFGWYSALSVGWSLLTFSDCEEESKLLESERARAIEDLSKKGISFDQDEEKKEK